ncbi:ATP-dependent RecD-like DNA helicase [Radiobacillus kanasensis]|uniref:SF1B family DNA helicase RecD2 n=1 Tax=Radiobacillus kanasensis TaxID=2844358 RepID=UPI001E2FFC7F|nr:ATP-dependent RecD-like DNA helicase [Radiobacillus kanasensis]UFT97873.1 ATP-dependent RecD-like DNA helicase [Radiobacillus kanasensis]
MEKESRKGFIKGELIHTIFTNEQEHFSIARIKVLETDEEVEEKELVVKGYFTRLDPGEIYLFQGEFENHKRFGRQYQVHHYERFIPETTDGIVSYLSSDLFYGIGKKTAQKIVDILGETAINQIMNDASVLKKVPGLKSEQAEQLRRSLQEHQGFEHIVVNLSKYGFGLKMAQKIYEAYKDKALEVLENDPYQFVFDIEGFGFQRADEVAAKKGILKNHPSRIQAGCIYVLHQSTFSGHVYLPLEDLVSSVEQLLNQRVSEVTFDEISKEVITLNTDQKIIVQDSKAYLPSLYYAETGFCSQLHRIMSEKAEEEVPTAELLKIIGALEEEEALSYGKKQFEAIEQALHSKVMILTGGPGTGKTTVIKGIINAYSGLYDLSLEPKDYDNELTFPFLLTAPTGRAAKRLSESTGLPAMTIHRLLGWNGHETFEKDSDNPLSGKLIVIDEFSMVDTWLANQLFRAIPKDMRVLIVGDEDQLPSVGPGQVLADLLASKQIPSVQLDEVYRQKEGSKIIQLAHEIKNNTCDLDSLQKDADFNFIPCGEHQVLDVVNQIVQKAYEKGVDMKDLQILAPMYKTKAGIHRINEQIQMIVNPPNQQKRHIKWGEVEYRTGDKVIQLVNQPEDGVFNGDIGEIVAIFKESETEDKTEQIVISFDEKEVLYLKKDLNHITHAYCTSIHKSQGSEFQIVVLPVVPSYRRMLRKNLLYTAITRSKNSLIICGDKHSFLQGIKEEDTNMRYTSLVSFLQEIFQLDQKVKEQVEEENEEISPYDFL